MLDTDTNNSYNDCIRPYRIMVFSWNTESVGLCETMNPEVAAQNRTSYSTLIPGMTTWKYSCDIPDFYPAFSKFILDHNPDIVVIGFQEDRYPGSYFHSHLLPEEMPKIGYALLKRTKLMGLGVTSYKGALNGDFFERGLRMSIYAKEELIPIIEREETEMRTAMGNDGQAEYVCSPVVIRGKGAVAAYIMLPGYGRIAFICCHLPFNPKTLVKERNYKNKMIRQTELNRCNVSFNSAIEKLVLFNGPVPSHVIYFGDFNYRLSDPRSATEVANELSDNYLNTTYLEDLRVKHDELTEQMRRKNIYEFKEGIDNHGPLFVPTCKLYKRRYTNDPNDPTNKSYFPMGTYYWKPGKHNHRVPSWCDRILYNKFSDDGRTLSCVYYDRFDVGTVMSKSDHAAIIGLFDLT